MEARIAIVDLGRRERATLARLRRASEAQHADDAIDLRDSAFVAPI